MTKKEFNKLTEAFKIIINNIEDYQGYFLHSTNATFNICDSGDLIINYYDKIFEDYYDHRINIKDDYKNNCDLLKSIKFRKYVSKDNPINNFEF